MHAGTTGFDFFSAGELPAPGLPADEVAGIVRDHWGLDVVLEPLGSQQDQNFLARPSAGGDPLGVVKITNPAFTAAELAAQDEAAARIAAAAPEFRIATTSIAPDGAPRSVVADTSEGRSRSACSSTCRAARCTATAYLSARVVARMGELAARASLALAGFEHPGLDRVLQWDLRARRPRSSNSSPSTTPTPRSARS